MLSQLFFLSATDKTQRISSNTRRQPLISSRLIVGGNPSGQLSLGDSRQFDSTEALHKSSQIQTFQNLELQHLCVEFLLTGDSRGASTSRRHCRNFKHGLIRIQSVLDAANVRWRKGSLVAFPSTS